MTASEHKEEPISVLILITDLITGGAQRALYRFLERVERDRQARYRFTVVTLFNGDGVFADRIQALGIEVIDLDMKPKWRVDRLIRLVRLINQHSPLILHTWMIHANIVGRVIGQLLSVPIVIISRRTDRLGGAWRVRVNRLLANWSDAVIAVSEETRQVELKESGINPDKVVTVPNGIDMSAFDNVPSDARDEIRQALKVEDDRFLIGSVGRLVTAKGYPDLLKAMVIVRDTYPHVRLIIVGEGDLRPSLEALMAELNIQDIVSMPGRRNDIPHFLNSLDLFVLSSLWEGMPNALLEGMAAGVPSIATAVSAAPEIIGEDEYGLLVPPHDPQALAEGIIRMIGDADLRQTYGKAGQQRIRTGYTLDQSVNKTLAIYSRFLDEKGLTPKSIKTDMVGSIYE